MSNPAQKYASNGWHFRVVVPVLARREIRAKGNAQRHACLVILPVMSYL
jgi:hypothetical protein